ncbi:MAG: trypsin-like peptidase domain-containing protein [Cyclobacteriaceae bacterium]
MKTTFKVIAIGFLSGLAGSYTGYHYFIEPSASQQQSEPDFHSVNFSPPDNANQPQGVRRAANALPVDFSDAASKATPSVVYINSISQGVSYSNWDWFFGESPGRQTQVSSGSGVIFTADGYIVTNNHVVASAERIEINYNKRVYPAELVGTDPSTDLAVIKIQGNDLPAISLGSSKDVQVGEWVIAVGNPFSLASTVTAGIVSAKGRKIGILEDKFPIESFIQTDAAINPGNSGGALVNKKGELVGINTAILSRTGSYTGYAFAVPVDIARKVFSDLVKYGIVQRAVFGGSVVEYDYAHAKKYDLGPRVENYQGVLLNSMDREGPAIQAGLKPGDIITRVNGIEVNSQSAFEEEISYRYPGDKVTIAYLRGNKPATTSVTLVNTEGTSEIIRRNILDAKVLGAHLESTQYGVKVFRIQDNSVFKQMGIPENFTIVAINRVRVKKPEEVVDFFQKFKGRGAIYGVNTSRQQIEIPFSIR